MNDLLTSKQVQDLLKVDRITVYRMLNDGRLKGVKIGQQWRFARREVERLLNGEPAAPEAPAETSIPVHCVQTIQDLFSGVSQIASVVVDPQGQPVTRVSQPGALYTLIAATESGQAAYTAEWQALINSPKTGRSVTSFDGTQALAAPITDQGQTVAYFVAGQFHWDAPDLAGQEARLRKLAADHNLPLDALLQAAATVTVLPPEEHTRAEAWPQTAARAVESILHERTSFVLRLQQIANLTQIS